MISELEVQNYFNSILDEYLEGLCELSKNGVQGRCRESSLALAKIVEKKFPQIPFRKEGPSRNHIEVVECLHPDSQGKKQRHCVCFLYLNNKVYLLDATFSQYDPSKKFIFTYLGQRIGQRRIWDKVKKKYDLIPLVIELIPPNEEAVRDWFEEFGEKASQGQIPKYVNKKIIDELIAQFS